MSYADAVNEKTKDIKPVTREEMFLQKIADNVSGGGGTGGGGADLLNEHGFLKKEVLPPGYGYATFSENTMYLNESELTFSEDDGMYYYNSPINYYLKIGETYSIRYNGVEYSCVAIDGTAMGINGVILGNVDALLGGEGTGEPFIIGIYGNTSVVEYSGVASIVPLDGQEITGNISIIGNLFQFTDFDIEVLSNSPFIFEFTLDGVSELNLKANASIRDVRRAINFGRTVIAYFRDTVFQLNKLGKDGENPVFSRVSFEGSSVNVETITMYEHGPHNRRIVTIPISI